MVVIIRTIYDNITNGIYEKTLIIWMIVSLTNYPLGSTDCFFPNGTKWYGSISCHPLWLGETFFYGIPSLKRCKCSEAVYLSLRFPVFLFMIVHDSSCICTISMVTMVTMVPHLLLLLCFLDLAGGRNRRLCDAQRWTVSCSFQLDRKPLKCDRRVSFVSGCDWLGDFGGISHVKRLECEVKCVRGFEHPR